MTDPEFPRRFAEAGRLGAYLRIINEGGVGARDDVLLVHRPAHGITIATVGHIYLRDHSRAGLLLRAPELAEGRRAWAREHEQPGGQGTRG